MERSALSEVVRSAIADVLGVAPQDVTEDTDLGREFEMDSLELMEVGSRLEKALNTRLDPADLASMRRVGDAVELLHRRRAAVS